MQVRHQVSVTVRQQDKVSEVEKTIHFDFVISHCNRLQQTATDCNRRFTLTLSCHTATHCNRRFTLTLSCHFDFVMSQTIHFDLVMSL